jgi:hypothetical protein
MREFIENSPFFTGRREGRHLVENIFAKIKGDPGHRAKTSIHGPEETPYCRHISRLSFNVQAKARLR